MPATESQALFDTPRDGERETEGKVFAALKAPQGLEEENAYTVVRKALPRAGKVTV